MKTSIKKTVFMTCASMLTAVILALCVAFAPMFITKAAIAYTQTISAGETWNEEWSSLVNEKTFKIDITETGFYDFTVTDHKQTGLLYIVVRNADGEYIFAENLCEYDEATETFNPISTKTTEKFILAKGQKYEVTCSYSSSEDLYSALDAKVSITLNKNNFKPETLPECNISDSDMRIQIESGCYEWFEFKTQSDGDYSFNISSYIDDGYVNVYSLSTGEFVDYKCFSDYHYIEYADEYVQSWRKNVTFNLKGNDTYYISFQSYDDGATCAVSMTKNTKTVKNIAVNAPNNTIDSSWASIDSTDFNYKISYTDGTSEIIDYYYDIWQKGYELPEFESFEDTVYVNGEFYFLAGKQPIATTYNDVKTVIFADVFSVTDWLADIDAKAIDAYDTCSFKNNGITDDSGWWRIKVSKTGVYNMYSYSSWDNIDYNFVLIDQYNNIVKYNDAQDGFPLVAGNEYALNMQCNFKNSNDSKFDFWIESEKDALFSDTDANGWYNDAVTYSVGSGIITGYGGTNIFGVADSIQRQDFILIIARYAGVDLNEYAAKESSFSDVPEGTYYEGAVNWGAEKGIITGYGGTNMFGVGDSITREQLVLMLCRYAKEVVGKDVAVSGVSVDKFKDYGSVSGWATDAVLWAIENRVITGAGVGKDLINPQGNAQRCEIAQIMYNIFKNDIL